MLTPVQLQLLAEALREPVRSFTLLLETVCDGHFDKPKTKRGMRTIPIGAETAEILTVLASSHG